MTHVTVWTARIRPGDGNNPDYEMEVVSEGEPTFGDWVAIWTERSPTIPLHRKRSEGYHWLHSTTSRKIRAIS